MSNHLKACWNQQIASAPTKAVGSWFHLVVEGSHAPDYWLHLQAYGKSAFGDLDQVLRRVWLECCGHMSAFEFPVKRLPRGTGRAFTLAAMLGGMDWGDQPENEDDEELMAQSLGSKLQPGMVFSHEYDFGSTTKLALRVITKYSAPAVKGPIKVLARNEPPLILCSVCDKPATQLCQECGSGMTPLCEACASQHECGEDMQVPLVNSPRSGVCGYCGPSVEP
jgi:hypothetical protein